MIRNLRAGLFWLALAPAVLFGCNGTLVQNNPEICDNGVDDNNDGLADCDDSACVAAQNCVIPSDCGNGTLDAGEQCDGALLGGNDCADAGNFNSGTLACSATCTFDTSGCTNVAISENTEATCANGIDDDTDGFIDCADTQCVGTNACVGVENCGDGVDNDFDNAIDCADNDCRAGANPDLRCQEGFVGGNINNCTGGVDNDLDGDTDCDDSDCAGNVACGGTPEVCSGGQDEDNDGLVDCQDADCVNDAACQASPDIDCDGIANADEAGFGTSATNADSDGDGILDGIEVGRTTPVAGSVCPGFVADADPATTTNPTDTDTDNDGLLDGAEDANQNGRIDNLESDPNLADTDGDGLNDNLETTLGTSPTDNDTDNDGLLDGVEDANQNGVKDANETSALSADTDCDGLSDSTEVNGNTDATKADTDGDAITDGVELGVTAPINGTNCVNVKLDANPATTTNPNAIDSDNDGIIDGAEDRNQNGAVDANELNPNSTDSDNDFLPDGIEDANKNGVKDANETDGTRADTDADGIADGTEDLNRNGIVNAGEMNPRTPDSDNDGINDGIEDANQNGTFDNGETNGTNRDTDGDTLSDGIEDLNRNGVRDAGESSPLLADSDTDGLNDAAEDANGNGSKDANETATFSSDTDCDGASDFNEVSNSFAGGLKTNPLVADTDGDTLPDGQELGATAILANSGCATISVDADPLTKTDPTRADSDNDGRADGCEDINRNGRVDANELNPLAFDTDGDNLSDAAEDANGNCIQDNGETGGLDSDSDNDGIGDAIETTVTNTNPLNPDTDGDNILDGVEDANQDGDVNLGETNPNDTDTDNDGINDGIEDADRDGNFDAGETDPADTDTDGDGLLDGAEDANQNGVVNNNETDPRTPDTDGDGLNDGVEDTINTDPLDPDTDGDGIIDSDEVLANTDPLNPNDPSGDIGGGIEAVCTSDTLKPVNFFEDIGGLAQGGDWTVALETFYAYASATQSNGDHVATFRDDSALANTQVGGFVLGLPLPAAGTNATTQAQALIARLTAGNATLGAAAGGVSTFFNGRQITSSDNFEEVVDIQVNITLTAATDPNTMRNRVIAVLSNRALNTFTGLPGVGGATTTTYVLRFSSLVRTGIPGIAGARLALVGGVLSAATFNNNALIEGIELRDLSNGTPLARAFVGDTFVCNPFVATAAPKADFIWMADISGSTDNDRTNIATASGTVFTALTNNGVDFRMGVVPNTENSVQQVAANAGDLRSGFTRSQTTFIADLNNTSNVSNGVAINSGCEYGLSATDNAILKALPRTTGAESATKLRDDAIMVAFYISDEHANEVENENGCNNLTQFPLQTATGVPANGRATPNAAQQANINTTVQPFINRINSEGGVAFGQILPIQAPFCGDAEDGRGYLEVINATGGSFYRTCDTDPGAVLQQIVDAVTGAASEFVLSDFPISSTIKVALNRNGVQTAILVPRSAVNGFDYDPAANTIFFRGATFRPAINDKITVSFRLYTPPVPPLVCAAPLVVNAAGTACECVSNTSTGQCGTGAGSDTCSAAETCNADPAVCGCECKPDCGGTVTGNFECGFPTVCGPVCGDANNDGTADCNNACTGNFTCNAGSCGCECRDTTPGGANDCNGIIVAPSREVCDVATCNAFCPADCGGCGANERCDIASCTCIDNGQG